MPDVFISYSRKDKDFVQRLHGALANINRDVWVDWEDIPASADWWREIQTGIESADTFVFVISPDSLGSDVCRREIDHAVANNKRFVPILRRQSFAEDTGNIALNPHPAVNSHNWIYFREEDNFDTAFQTLISAIDTDLDYVRQHTRLLVRAKEWDRDRNNRALLLDGTELRKAESWLASGVNKKPAPTDLHADYIAASRAAESRRQRFILSGVTLAFFVAIALAIFGFIQSRVAQQNEATATFALGLSQLRVTEVAQQANIAATNAQDALNNAVTATLAQGRAVEQANVAATNAAQAVTNAAVALNNAATATIAQGEALYQAATAQAAGATSVANANFAQTQAAIAKAAGATSDANGIIAKVNAMTAQAAKNDAQNQAYNAQTQAANATLAQGQALDQANIAATSAANATIAQGEALYQAATAQAAGATSIANAATATIAQGEALNQAATATNALGIAQNRGTQVAVQAVTATIAQGEALLQAATAQAAKGTSDANALLAEQKGATATYSLGEAIAARATAVFNEQETRAQALAVSAEQIFDAGNPDLAIALAIEAGKINPALAQAQRLLNRATPLSVRLNFDLSSQSEPETFRDARGNLVDRPITVYGFTGLFSPDSRWFVTAKPDDGRALVVWDIASRQPLYQLEGHNAWVTSAVFTSDGKYLVSAAEDGELIAWDMGSGTLLRRLGKHGGRVNVLAAHPSQDTVASGGEDGKVMYWDVAGGTLLKQSPQGHGVGVRQVFFSADGSQIYSYAYNFLDPNNTTPKVGILPTGKDAGFFRNPPLYRGYSPDGRYAYTGADGKGFLQLWNAKEVSKAREFRRGTAGVDYITAIAFSPTGNMVMMQSETRAYNDPQNYRVTDRYLALWNIADGSEIRRFRITGDPRNWEVNSIAFSPDAKYAVTGGRFGRVYTVSMWNVSTGEEIRHFNGHNDTIDAVAFSPDGQYIYSRSKGNSRIWDVSERAAQQLNKIGISASKIGPIGFSPDSALIYAYPGQNDLAAYDPTSGQQDERFLAGGVIAFRPGRTEALSAFSSSGACGAITNGEFSTGVLWNMTKGQFIGKKMECLPLNTQSVAFNGDGRIALFAGILDSFSKQHWERHFAFVTYDMEKRQILVKPNMPTISDAVNPADLKGRVIQAIISPDARLVAAIVERQPDPQKPDVRRTIIIWDAATGEERRQLQGYRSDPLAIAFSPDSRSIAAGIADPENSILIWDASSGAPLLTLIGHSKGVRALAFSPAGDTLLSGSDDNQLFLWDLNEGQLLRRFTGHTAPVEQVAFSSDGFKAISANSKDGIIVWKIEALTDTVAWTRQNRYILELTCPQRQQYNALPLCNPEGLVPSPTPTGTLLPTATPTITPTPSLTPTPTPTPVPMGTITTNARVRSGAGQGFAQIASAAAGTDVIILEENAGIGWMKVRLPDGTEGWVLSTAVRKK
jgi:WD40 repeat protein